MKRPDWLTDARISHVKDTILLVTFVLLISTVLKVGELHKSVKHLEDQLRNCTNATAGTRDTSKYLMGVARDLEDSLPGFERRLQQLEQRNNERSAPGRR